MLGIKTASSGIKIALPKLCLQAPELELYRWTSKLPCWALPRTKIAPSDTILLGTNVAPPGIKVVQFT
jgi:hypothetical protein